MDRICMSGVGAFYGKAPGFGQIKWLVVHLLEESTQVLVRSVVGGSQHLFCQLISVLACSLQLALQ